MEGLREKVEGLFRTCKVLGPKETLIQFLKKPYPEVRQGFHHGIEELKCILRHPHDDTPNFFNAVWIAALVDVLYTIKTTKRQNVIVKANADKLREEMGALTVQAINPYILALFKWDLDRRSWKHKEDRINFLKKTKKDLEEEIKGERDNQVKKYVGLILDWFISQMDKGLFSFPEMLDQMKIDKEQAYNTRNQIKEFADNGLLSQFIDSDIEGSYLELLKPVAQNFVEGRIKSTNRFDYLILAFVNAQNDFKNIVGDLIKKLSQESINDLEQALIDENIESFISQIRSIIKTIPNKHKKANESYFHVILHIILKSVGIDVSSEVPLINGVIDSVIELDDIIYIFEYKLSDSEAALKQIKDRKYHEAYLYKRKKIRLLGLSFDVKESNVSTKYSTEVIQ